MVLDNVNLDLREDEVKPEDWFRIVEIKEVDTKHGKSNIAILSRKNQKFDLWLGDSDARLLKRFLLSEKIEDIFRVCLKIKFEPYINKKGEPAKRAAISELKAEVLK